MINDDPHVRFLLDGVSSEASLFCDYIESGEAISLSELNLLLRWKYRNGLTLYNENIYLAEVDSVFPDILDIVENVYWKSSGVTDDDFPIRYKSSSVDLESVALNIFGNGNFDPKSTFYFQGTVSNSSSSPVNYMDVYKEMQGRMYKERDDGFSLIRRSLCGGKFQLLESMIEIALVSFKPEEVKRVVLEVLGFIAHHNRLSWRRDDKSKERAVRFFGLFLAMEASIKGGNDLAPFVLKTGARPC